jgi:hypothetical protein
MFQLSPPVVSPEILVAKGGTVWARNGPWILPEIPEFPVAFRDLLHAVNLRHGTDSFTSPTKEGVQRIFSPWKIWRLRPGLNSRTWVPKASTLPLDHRSRFYWYYDSICFGRPFCPSSGVFSRTSALVHFMQLWWPFATRSGMELHFHPAPGSKRSSNLHKMYRCRCRSKNSWWCAERLPETYRVVIPIKLKFGVSTGFIHREL